MEGDTRVNDARQELLQSIVDVARAIFFAKASSVALLDESVGDFVFEAVAGKGSEHLVGSRFPAGSGIAGSVAQTREGTIIDDLSRDPRFARDVAQETGYVPRRIMAAPLLRGERTLGVLSVLDRGETDRGSRQELALLVEFATQAALAIDLSAAGPVHQADDRVAELLRRLDSLEDARRDAADRLLAALGDLLE
jgi:GAF domain-containing protein